MAASAAMQSILATPMNRNSTVGRTRHLHRYCFTSLRNKDSCTLRVRCSAEDSSKEVKEQTPIPPPPAPKPKVSTKFSDVLAFGGPAPERINGRLAMVGFVAAMAVELSNGQDLFAQISDGGIAWFVGTSVVLSLASLVPLFKGVSVQSQSGGVMSSDAELWNGRLAMVGLVALALTEYVKGGALV